MTGKILDYLIFLIFFLFFDYNRYYFDIFSSAFILYKNLLFLDKDFEILIIFDIYSLHTYIRKILQNIDYNQIANLLYAPHLSYPQFT